jgi:hypothetical protein
MHSILASLCLVQAVKIDASSGHRRKRSSPLSAGGLHLRALLVGGRWTVAVERNSYGRHGYRYTTGTALQRGTLMTKIDGLRVLVLHHYLCGLRKWSGSSICRVDSSSSF